MNGVKLKRPRRVSTPTHGQAFRGGTDNSDVVPAQHLLPPGRSTTFLLAAAVKCETGAIAMPKAWGEKDERQYAHVNDSEKNRGKSDRHMALIQI